MRWAVLALAALLVGCAPDDGFGRDVSYPRELPFLTIDQGQYSAATQRGEVVARDAESWAELWSLAHGNEQPAPPSPPIDFSEEMAIAVFMGQRNTGGYTIEIERIVEHADRIELGVRQTAPGGFVTQAITSPYHIVRVARSDKPVAWAAEEPTVDGPVVQ